MSLFYCRYKKMARQNSAWLSLNNSRRWCRWNNFSVSKWPHLFSSFRHIFLTYLNLLQDMLHLNFRYLCPLAFSVQRQKTASFWEISTFFRSLTSKLSPLKSLSLLRSLLLLRPEIRSWLCVDRWRKPVICNKHTVLHKIF